MPQFWINKICRINKLTPQYIRIKMKGNEQSKNTKLAKLYKLYLLQNIHQQWSLLLSAEICE
jgi:hypothetical protein